MTRRFRAVCEYDGSGFAGWQIQPNALTVQGCIEHALASVLREPVRVSASGRTDAGVHALGQVISFVTERDIPPDGIRKGANGFLPEGVRLTSVEPVSMEFDPRRNAVLRWYRYLVLNRPEAPSWCRGILAHFPYPLDDVLIQKTTAFFRGEHDFNGFRSADCEAERTVLTMETCEAWRRGALIIFDLRCRSFLMNMVRIIIGGILDVARGRLHPDVLSEALDTGCRNDIIPTAPARGLTLVRVYYPGDAVEPPPDGALDLWQTDARSGNLQDRRVQG